GGVSIVDVVHNLAGNKLTDVLLRFERTSTDVRCKDRIRQSAKFRNKFFVIACRFERENVYRASCNLTTENILAQCLNVYHMTTAKVNEYHTFLHQRKLRRTDQVCVAAPAINVKRHDICLLKHFFHCLALNSITK